MFHSFATGRKKSNSIPFLETEDGRRVDSKEGMSTVIMNYFLKVFGEINRTEVDISRISPRRVNEEQNRDLTKEVTFDESFMAINQMHPDKASGPDGLNPVFYQNFWNIMGAEIFNCCKKWLNGEAFPADLNCTNVVLIPKKKGACRMKDLRPIALCNVLYKIMAKVLSNRLKQVLPELISEKQSAFLPERSITDNVIVAFEVVHHMRRGRVKGDGEVALKLDISKAYDRVKWSYLRSRMFSMGFCKKWVDWIMRCVTTVSYNICLNGELIGPIYPKRGLRQEDPLSPYLFLLCVEGLSNAIDEAEASGGLHGSHICEGAPEVSHLLFADDSFLFFKATSQEACRVKNILATYEELSGQSVNFQKSGVLFSSNVRRDKQIELSDILEVHNDINDGSYLGLPSLVRRSKKRVFGFIKERVCKRVQSWESKPVSRAGKLVLVKNVGQAIPSYAMSCFLLPKTLFQEVERVLNRYWWKSGGNQSRGITWLSWRAMSMSKSQCGMGFRYMYGFNIALLGKQVWRCITKPHMLVSRVLKTRYFSDVSLLNAKKGQGGSCIWSSI